MAHSNAKPPSPSVSSAAVSRGALPTGSRPQLLRPCVRSSEEASHELEKLEFALAVAITRGDQERAAVCRAAIDALGGNREEPGT
ncbi:MAG: hypothetical protein ACKOCM_05810 [Cyanobacteriota bacterium]